MNNLMITINRLRRIIIINKKLKKIEKKYNLDDMKTKRNTLIKLLLKNYLKEK